MNDNVDPNVAEPNVANPNVANVSLGSMLRHGASLGSSKSPNVDDWLGTMRRHGVSFEATNVSRTKSEQK